MDLDLGVGGEYLSYLHLAGVDRLDSDGTACVQRFEIPELQAIGVLEAA